MGGKLHGCFKSKLGVNAQYRRRALTPRGHSLHITPGCLDGERNDTAFTIISEFPPPRLSRQHPRGRGSGYLL